MSLSAGKWLRAQSYITVGVTVFRDSIENRFTDPKGLFADDMDKTMY